MKTTVAIVGEYQIGKSTLVNCLLKSCKAITGRGLRTTAEIQRYELTSLVDLVDTPGFDASKADDEMASSAIKDAFSFILVMKAKMLSDTDMEIMRKIFKTGRRSLLVYNCDNMANWDPEDENNQNVSQNIEAQIANAGLNDACMPINDDSILMVNALWAAYGLGLLQQQAESKNDTVAEWAKGEIRKIEKFIKGEFDDIPLGQYKEEMLRRSNINVLIDFLEEMPLKVLISFTQDASKEIKRISDRFLADLQKHCTEFTDRIKGIDSK